MLILLLNIYFIVMEIELAFSVLKIHWSKKPKISFEKLGEDKKRLSTIIDKINEATGSNFDRDIVVKSILQLRDLLMKSSHLRSRAKNNSEQDFELSYFDRLDDMLIEGLAHNKEFFTLLLNNANLKKEVLGTFAEKIYDSLRGGVAK